MQARLQIVNLLDDLQDDFGLTYMFVAHDLGVVRHVSDRLGVMYVGRLVEVGPAERIYERPVHPYTHALLSAIPVPDPRQNAARPRVILKGDVPSSIDPPAACRFHTRCPLATELCSRVEPPLVDYGGGHLAACHHPIGVTSEELASAFVAPESPAGAGDEPPPANEAGRPWIAADAP